MKTIKALSARAVDTIKEDGWHAVGGAPGLLLQVRGAGRSWVLRTMVGGKRKVIGIGPCSLFTLAEARVKALALLKHIHETGALPVVSQNKGLTFGEAAEKLIEAKRPEWKNAKHADQWASTIEQYCKPLLDMPVKEIELKHVLSVLEPIWATKPETASRLRGRMESVLDWARVRGHRDGDNPAEWRGNLDSLLAKPSKIKNVTHHKALPYKDLPEFWQTLADQEGIAVFAVRLAILTACRSGEIRNLMRSDIDLGNSLIEIPADRMKAGKPHVIPLSEAALHVIQSTPRLDETLVFSATRSKPLSDMTLTAVLRRMGRGDLTMHGFRSTFRDWAGETTQHPREVIEHALAHQLKDKAEAAYARGTLLDKRRLLMQDWANYCLSASMPGNVTLLRKATA